jgi:branched-subunit amino acid aminotransferase/4-amino-4-deoxychorismate lyase
MDAAPEKTWVWDETGFVPCSGVPVSDRGFRYGMSLFESLRVTASGPEHLEAHLESLREACESRAFPVSSGVLGAAGDLLKKQAPRGGGDHFARIYVTAGDGAPTAPVTGCRVLVMSQQRPRPVQSAYRVTVADTVYCPPFAGLKTGNYWVNLEALRRAQTACFEEALLFNENAELVSACVANVFLVHGERIRTPSRECGARPGVIRRQVLRRMAAQECSLFLEDVLTADEIFLTNSWIGVMPVGTLGGRKLPSTAVSAGLRL